MESRSLVVAALKETGYEPGCQNPETENSFHASEDTARYFCGACAVRSECLADVFNGLVLLGTKPRALHFGGIKAGLSPSDQLAIAQQVYSRPLGERGKLLSTEDVKQYLPPNPGV